MPTTFDNGFRTLVELVTRFLIGLANLIWGYSFTDNAVITLLPSDSMVMQDDRDRAQRRGDAFFKISENGLTVYFHMECQSTVDKGILDRFAKYDNAFAYKVRFRKSDGALVLPRPRAGLIELRPKSMKRKSTTIVTQEPTGETVDHEVTVITPLDYSLSELFDQNALFLVPFFPFRYARDLQRKNMGKKKAGASG